MVDPFFPLQVISTEMGPYDPDARQWTIGTLLPGHGWKLMCTVAIPDTIPYSWDFHLMAVATSDTPDPNLDNNWSRLWVEVG
jgi:hypothetical protein